MLYLPEIWKLIAVRYSIGLRFSVGHIVCLCEDVGCCPEGIPIESTNWHTDFYPTWIDCTDEGQWAHACGCVCFDLLCDSCLFQVFCSMLYILVVIYRKITRCSRLKHSMFKYAIYGRMFSFTCPSYFYCCMSTMHFESVNYIHLV